MRFDGKKIVYVDMDHVLCDYNAGFMAHQAKYPDLEFPQSQPGLYQNLEPMPGAIEVYSWLSRQPELAVFILTSPSIRNPHCYSEKRIWVENHLGPVATYNLIISPHKDLSKGDFLIDDNASGKGQDHFEGKLILFGSLEYPDWWAVQTFFSEAVLRRK